MKFSLSPFLSRSSSPSLSLSCVLFLPISCHSLHTLDQEYYEGTDYLSPLPADGERTEEFEYEVNHNHSQELSPATMLTPQKANPSTDTNLTMLHTDPILMGTLT